MDTQGDRDASRLRYNVSSAWLVIGMTSALRIATWSANELTLWYLYGWSTMMHDHLQIIRMKPNLVVSNGDVLRGIGPYNYLVGVAIWLPLTFGFVLPIYYMFMPRWQRELLQLRKRNQSVNVVGMIWALALFFLVPGLLPVRPGLAIGFGSVAAALIWVRRIPSPSSQSGLH